MYDKMWIKSDGIVNHASWSKIKRRKRRKINQVESTWGLSDVNNTRIVHIVKRQVVWSQTVQQQITLAKFIVRMWEARSLQRSRLVRFSLLRVSCWDDFDLFIHTGTVDRVSLSLGWLVPANGDVVESCADNGAHVRTKNSYPKVIIIQGFEWLRTPTEEECKQTRADVSSWVECCSTVVRKCSAQRSDRQK